jgi:cell division protein FtsB
MDGPFYRKEKKRSRLRDRIVKLLKNKNFMVRFGLAATVVLYLLFDSHGILTHVRLLQQRAELQEKIRRAELEQKQLQAEVKALEGDPRAIEKVAREKYGMIREGETVYKVNRK